MKRLFRKTRKSDERRYAGRRRWDSFRITVVGGSIVAGAAMWALAMAHVATRGF
jgi:hypothetical protein